MTLHPVSRELPHDHHIAPTRHETAAQQMRETDDWVLIGTYATRRSAYNAAARVRNSEPLAYRGHLYDARAITTATVEHQVWGRWIGPREVHR